VAWFQIQLDAPNLLRDAIINRLFELGAGGVNEGPPELPNRITGFFPQTEKEAVSKDLPIYLSQLAELNPSLPSIRFKIEDVADENWADNHRKFYRAQRLSGEFFLLPAWEDRSLVPPGMEPIILEPGQAFGTGLHPSTQMCVRMLERCTPLYQPLGTRKVIDVGTGTGILAIVAEKLGFGQVDAIDNDPIAVESAQENVERNACRAVKVSGEPLSKKKGTYDVVVSNILLEAHRELALDYLRLLPEAGLLILSGLLSHQASEMFHIFGNLDFVFESQVTLQEWTALGFTRGAKERE